jgi:putative ABC transport system permease protein
VAMSVAILVVGMFMIDGVNLMIDLQFRQVQREDVSVSFIENRPERVRYELSRLPGVSTVETWRTVPVRLTAGHRSLDSAIQGMPADSQLRRIISADGREQPLPADGLLLSRFLADRLQLSVGDRLELQLLEGQRRLGSAEVSGIVDDLLGTAVYMDMTALERLSGEAGIVSGAWLAVDPNQRDALYRALKGMPMVGGVSSPDVMLESFETEMAEVIYIVIGFLAGFAAIISVGVIYNGARIALSERGRELASLRVMGFHRSEVTFLLLGEQAVITLAAIPLGFLIGYGLSWSVVQAMQNELFRIPFVVAPRTWVLATVITLIAAAASGLAVRRRLHRYDLISVLKTRE